MASYIAIIHKDAESDYGASFPDFPGAVSAGSTVDEARAGAAEALGLHIRGMEEDGQAIPEPSSLEDVMALPDFADGVAVLIDAPKTAKAVRVNITAAEDVLNRIDAYAEANGFTRSGFLIKAALDKMHAA
ncbi:MAG: type II toxin-antitoxin system HicB family antitoxin [Parvibaculum sp.]|nr:type II toxin-antitoxin system HicB family antitoxin [Parvibaculum sp.]